MVVVMKRGGGGGLEMGVVWNCVPCELQPSRRQWGVRAGVRLLIRVAGLREERDQGGVVG